MTTKTSLTLWMLGGMLAAALGALVLAQDTDTTFFVIAVSLVAVGSAVAGVAWGVRLMLNQQH